MFGFKFGEEMNLFLKVTLVLFVVLIFFIVISFQGFGFFPASDAKSVTIGFIIPMSGAVSYYKEYMVPAAKIA